jgi:hypothetical protein
MEYLNPNVLRQFPRSELLALYRRMVSAIAELPANTPERAVALANLANIRCALAQYPPGPR